MRRAIGLIILAGAAPCAAQPIDWNNAGGGNWNDPLNWNPMNVPNAVGETANISLAGMYTVVFNTSTTFGGLFINNAAATVTIPTGNLMAIDGATSTNNGLIVVNSTMGGSGTLIRWNQDCALGGTGRITLNANANRDTGYLDTSGVAVVTNGTSHTIDGTGRVYAALTNDGLVDANVNGAVLEMLQRGKSNVGIMRASNGGVLQVSAVNIAQGPLARIEAITGGQILFSNGVTNGRIDASGGQTIINGSSTFTSVAHSGPLNIPTGNVLIVNGMGLDNTDTVTVNTTQGGSGTLIRFSETGTLSGPGLVRLNANPNTNTAYLETTGGAVMTHASPHRIAGTGRIFSSMINNSLISADVTDRTLELLTNNKTNNGDIEATNGGTLLISSINVMQGAGGRFVADGGTLLFSNATTNGRIRANDGSAVISGSVTWNNVHASGPVGIPTGNNLLIRGTSLRNEGTVTVNTTQGGSGTVIRFDESGAFTGAGNVLLNANANRDTAYIDTNTGISATNGTTHTINGTGRIHAQMTNEGLISADVAGRVLELLGKPKTNRGMIEARNGSTVQVTSITVDQELAGMFVADGGSIVFSNSTTNGPIDATNGDVTISGTTTFRDVELTGPAGILTGNNLLIRGSGLVNDGTVTVNTTQGGSGTQIRFDEDGEFSGSGDVLLNASTNRDTAYIDSNTNITAANAASHTIHGTGRIYAQLNNEGLIVADVDQRVLELLGKPKENSGIIEAVNGSTLLMTSVSVTQMPGGVIRADGGHVTMTNSAVTGDLDFTAGTANTTGNTTFTDVHLVGEVGVDTGSNLRLASSLVNDGTIVVNRTAGGGATTLQLLDHMTIEGSGSILLNASTNLDTAYIDSPNAAVTISFGEDQTLAGRGRIYKPLTMHGTISPGMSAGYLEPRVGYTQSSTGVYHCEVGGTAAGQFDQIGVVGQANLAGELRISRIGGFQPGSCDSIPILTATGGVVGAFDTITGMSPGTNKIWRVFYGTNAVTLRSTCYADFNGDCVFDIFDFLEWQNSFVAMNAEACDCDVTTGPGVCDIFDFLCFANLFAAGGC